MRLLFLLPLFASSLAEAQERAAQDNSIQGCWELVKGSGFHKGERCLKFIAANRETWVYFNPKTQTPESTAGGEYRLQGTEFTIRFDYASKDHKHLLKGPYTFKYIRTGDILRITEEVNGRIRMDQEWRLCK
jgi:hypothetical protein